VDIEIITRSSSESRAKEMLDDIRIDIDDSNPSSNVEFRTVISNGRSSGNNSFEINYTVSMPGGNPLNVKNSFGDTYLGNYSGLLTLKESYGNLKTESLEGKSDVDLSFGSGSIGNMKTGSLKVSYSNLDAGLIGQADVNSQFSNLEIDKVVNLALVAKYGEVDFGTVNTLKATVNFSSFEIDQLDKQLILDIQYGGKADIGQISKDLQLLDITSSFGPVKVDLPQGLNAHIRVKVEFGNMHYDEDQINFNRIHEAQTSKEYEGKIGNGSASVNVLITNKYGDVSIDTY
jgi:hypothetical protein